MVTLRSCPALVGRQQFRLACPLPVAMSRRRRITTPSLPSSSQAGSRTALVLRRVRKRDRSFVCRFLPYSPCNPLPKAAPDTPPPPQRGVSLGRLVLSESGPAYRSHSLSLGCGALLLTLSRAVPLSLLRRDSPRKQGTTPPFPLRLEG